MQFSNNSNCDTLYINESIRDETREKMFYGNDDDGDDTDSDYYDGANSNT